jgi:hypothetical protein
MKMETLLKLYHRKGKTCVRGFRRWGGEDDDEDEDDEDEDIVDDEDDATDE